MTNTGRLLIIGGVAGGASAAARARRLCETSSIIVFDRGPFVSFANCGLPYFVGDVIKEESNLIVASPQLFMERYRSNGALPPGTSSRPSSSSPVRVESRWRSGHRWRSRRS